MTESVVYCHQISQEIVHMQSKFSTAYRRDAQFPSWPLPETLGRVFLTFLPFSDNLFALHYFLQVFMCVGVHSGIPHMLISVPDALLPGTICPSYWTPFSADDIVWYLSLHISHHYPPLSGFFPWAKTFLLSSAPSGTMALEELALVTYGI